MKKAPAKAPAKKVQSRDRGKSKTKPNWVQVQELLADHVRFVQLLEGKIVQNLENLAQSAGDLRKRGND
jgi:hypothetical protein